MFKNYLKNYREIITGNDSNNGICFDGVVDQERYFACEKKLMFLLKETNGNKNSGEKNEKLEDWDYMKWIHEQAEEKIPLYRSVFRNIAMWSKMFKVYTTENREPEISEFVDDNGIIINSSLCNTMLEIAIVNLKKSWGNGNTEWKTLNTYLEADPVRKEILLHQFEELAPSIVMCCGTFDFAQRIFGKSENTIEETTFDGKKVTYFKIGSTMFVKCYHPSRPGWSRKDSFAHANSIFKTILK